MKGFNDALANMSKEELEMALKEQDQITVEILTKSVLQQQEFSMKQSELVLRLEEVVTSMGEVMKKENNLLNAKVEVLSQTIDKYEKMVENMGAGDVLGQIMGMMNKQPSQQPNQGGSKK